MAGSMSKSAPLFTYQHSGIYDKHTRPEKKNLNGGAGHTHKPLRPCPLHASSLHSFPHSCRPQIPLFTLRLHTHTFRTQRMRTRTARIFAASAALPPATHTACLLHFTTPRKKDFQRTHSHTATHTHMDGGHYTVGSLIRMDQSSTFTHRAYTHTTHTHTAHTLHTHCAHALTAHCTFCTHTGQFILLTLPLPDCTSARTTCAFTFDLLPVSPPATLPSPLPSAG